MYCSKFICLPIIKKKKEKRKKQEFNVLEESHNETEFSFQM